MCANVIPTAKGFKAAPSPVSAGYSALSEKGQGAALVRKTDDSGRFFVGTASTLQEGAGGSWTDRTGATLNGLGGTDRWRFAQFGDTTLAVASTEIVRFIDSGTQFAAATTAAPKASIVEVVNNFVFLLNVTDQGNLYDNAARPNGWWCAAKGGYTSWTPSITTEAATGTLQSTPGTITAGRRFGDQLVVYKKRSAYLATYVGQPEIWHFELLPGEAGALTQEVVVNVGDDITPKHVTMGFDNFYEFDGARFTPIGNPIKDTVFAELNRTHDYACQASHDPANKLVRFYYPLASSANPERCVVWNYATRKWGREDRQIECVVDYAPSGLTYTQLGSSYSTYDDLPSVAYDIAFASSSSIVPAIFDTTHTLKTLNGASVSSSITFGDIGDDTMYSTLNRARLRFITPPASANLTNYYKDNSGDSWTVDLVTAMANSRFDVLRSARWHRLQVDFNGDHEFTAGEAVVVGDGEE